MSGTPADVDAVVVEPVRGVHCEIGPLEDYLDADPETRSVTTRAIWRQDLLVAQALSRDLS